MLPLLLLHPSTTGSWTPSVRPIPATYRDWMGGDGGTRFPWTHSSRRDRTHRVVAMFDTNGCWCEHRTNGSTWHKRHAW